MLENIIRDLVYNTFFKKISLKMAPQKGAETCSCEICEKSCNNNCLIDSCVRLYIVYIYILLIIEQNSDVSAENYPPDNYLTEVELYRGKYRTMIIFCRLRSLLV